MPGKSISNELMNIYDLMFSKAGSRHWWPAKGRFEVIVGAVLTQFVSWKNVETAIKNLEDAGALSIQGICEIDTGRLEDLIRCTRFYKQKAKKLKVFCMHVKSLYGGSLDRLFDKGINELRSELLSLYGIGEETADCIILYAAGKPIFVVDAYTRRIFCRLGYFDEGIKYREMQEFFSVNIPKEVKLYNEYHAQIVGIGANYCYGKKPKCNECSLERVCIKKNIG